MPDIEIKRGYEVLPDNNVRFGIRVINNSDFAISDIEVLLDYSDSLFELSDNKVQKLGTIPPAIPRSAKFILEVFIHSKEIKLECPECRELILALLLNDLNKCDNCGFPAHLIDRDCTFFEVVMDGYLG